MRFAEMTATALALTLLPCSAFAKPPKPHTRRTPLGAPEAATRARPQVLRTPRTDRPEPSKQRPEPAETTDPSVVDDLLSSTATPPPTPSTTPDAPTDPATPPAEEESVRKIDFGGRLVTYIRFPTGSLDRPFQQLSTSLWLEARARMSAGTYAQTSLIGDLLTPSLEGKIEVRGRAREAFLAAHGHGIEARIGQQVISWGNADGVTAVDFLSGRDFSFFSAQGETSQIGAPAVLATYASADGSSPLRLAMVWQPVFPASRVPVPKSLLPPNVNLLEADRPELSLANSELAVKLGWAPGGWDAALIAFRGFSHMPEAYFKSIGQDGIVEIGRRFNRYLAFGGQASIAEGPWVFRLEGAYTVTENPGGRTALVQPSNVHTIAGIERPLGSRLRANVQGILRWHPFLASTLEDVGVDEMTQGINRQIARANSVFMNYTHAVRPGAGLALGYTSEDQALDIGVGAHAYFVGFDWVVEPMVGYALADAARIQVGAQLFGGEKNSLGALSSMNGVFAQVTYAF